MDNSQNSDSHQYEVETPESKALRYWILSLPSHGWMDVDREAMSDAEFQTFLKLVLLGLVTQKTTARLSKQGSPIEGKVVYSQCGYDDILKGFCKRDVLPKFPEWCGDGFIEMDAEPIFQARLSDDGEYLAEKMRYLCEDGEMDVAAREDYWREIASLSSGLSASLAYIARRSTERYAKLISLDRIQPQETVDGPCGNNQWRHDGEVAAGTMQVGAWKMVKHLWGLTDRVASFDDLIVPVYGDPEHIADEVAFGAMRREANKFFGDNGIPWKASLKKGSVSLRPAK